MLLLSREDIKKVFSIQDAIEADKKAFTLVADKKCDSPLRTNIQAPKYDGCFLFMPAYIAQKSYNMH
jgi:ornithine cyclodeaminase